MLIIDKKIVIELSINTNFNFQLVIATMDEFSFGITIVGRAIYLLSIIIVALFNHSKLLL